LLVAFKWASEKVSLPQERTVVAGRRQYCDWQ